MPENESITIGSKLGIFAAAHCEQIDYRFRVTTDKFDVKGFSKYFQEHHLSNALNEGMATCRPLDKDEGDYHLHFRWRQIKETMSLYVSYHAGILTAATVETEPFAEGFMAWLGGFFGNETAETDVHTEFEYPVAARQGRFPLPLKMSLIDDIESEINGINATFPSIPEGFTGAEIRRGKKTLTVELTGTTRVTFSTFEIKGELARLSNFAERLTEAK